ncbi:hypothetical protein Q5752_002228 [Cryptotrichosporon argae]
MSNNGEAKKPSPTVDFVAGVVAGAAGLVVGQPLDVVKVRYQTPEYAGRYSSIVGAFRDIIKEEKAGLRVLNRRPLIAAAHIQINGVVFTSYSFFMGLQVDNENPDEPDLRKIFLAGTGSGVVGSLLTCPTELIKIRQQSAPPYLNPSVFAVTRDIIRTNGLRGLYRGFSATALRDTAYGPYFCTYEATCRFFKSLHPPAPPARKHHHESLIDEAERELASGLSWAELMTAGGLAGVVAWIATFPFDVFKTRMQSTPWATSSEKRPGVWAVARHAVRTEGWRVTVAGLAPTLIRAVPTNMVIFLTFEACVAGMTR